MQIIDVTIFADASLHIETGSAGWGACIKHSPAPGLIVGGELREPASSSTHAELCAIANALHVARDRDLLGGVVMIQSDSLEALSCIRKAVPRTVDSPAAGGLSVPGRRKDIAGDLAACVNVIRCLVSACGIRLIVRHVRGHQKGDGRQWVNRECDRVAKLHMRSRRRAADAEATGADA